MCAGSVLAGQPNDGVHRPVNFTAGSAVRKNAELIVVSVRFGKFLFTARRVNMTCNTSAGTPGISNGKPWVALNNL